MITHRIVKSKEISPQTVVHLGIAIRKNGKHIGILYRKNQKESVEILHLMWWKKLASEVPTSDYTYWIRLGIERDRAAAIAGLCRRIWKQNRHDMPTYSLGSFKNYFQSDGRRITGPAVSGLTCAAFVLAIFHAAKLPLIRDEEWPRPGPDDLGFQKWVVEQLRITDGVPQADIAQCESEIGGVRFRPLEVAGAATSDQLPASYSFSKAAASQIGLLLTHPTA